VWSLYYTPYAYPHPLQGSILNPNVPSLYASGPYSGTGPFAFSTFSTGGGVTRGGSPNAPNYGNARIDTNIIQLTTPLQLQTNYALDYGYLGAASGSAMIGKCTLGSTGLMTCRGTDGATDSSNPGVSFCNNYSGGDTDQHWSPDHSMAIGCENGGSNTLLFWFAGTGSTITAAVAMRNAGGSLMTLPGRSTAFDPDSPRVIYDFCIGCSGVPGTNVLAIYKYDFSSCTYTGPGSCAMPTPTLVWDWGATGNCLAGINPTWNGIPSVSHTFGSSSRIFQIQVSVSGSQNSATLVALYETGLSGGLGCRIYNSGSSPQTFTGGFTIPPGSIVGSWGTTGDTGQVVMEGATYAPPSAAVSSISCSGPPGDVCTVYTTINPPIGVNVTIAGSSNPLDNGTFPVLYTGSAGFVFSSSLTTYNCAAGSGCGIASLPTTYYGIHGIYSSASINWLDITSANCDKVGTPTCSNTPVTSTNPYEWYMPTTHILVDAGMSGHNCPGNNSVVHGTNTPEGMMAFVSLFDSPTWAPGLTNFNLVPTVANSGSATLDSHCDNKASEGPGQWNTAYADTWPIMASTSNEIGSSGSIPNVENNGCLIPYPLPTTMWSCVGNPFLGPYTQEILGEPVSGPIGGTTNSQCASGTLYSTVVSGKTLYSCAPPLGSCTTQGNCQIFWRFGHSYTTVINPIFNAQNATINRSPDGYAFDFTTDNFCALGTSTATQIIGGVPTNQYNLTQAIPNSPVSGEVKYLGTIINGTSNYFAGQTFTISGFSNSGNNISCTVISSSAANLVCSSSTAVAETHAALATQSGTQAQPIVGGLPWVKSNNYYPGNIITPSTGNANNYSYQAVLVCSTAGANGYCTSHATVPSSGWTAGTVCDDGTTPSPSCSSGASIQWNYLGMQDCRSDLVFGITQ